MHFRIKDIDLALKEKSTSRPSLLYNRKYNVTYTNFYYIFYICLLHTFLIL